MMEEIAPPQIPLGLSSTKKLKDIPNLTKTDTAVTTIYYKMLPEFLSR